MTRSTRLAAGLTLAALLAASAGSAVAADIAPLVAPSPTPVFNWAGGYVGLSGGYGWGDSTASTGAAFNIGNNGGTLGGQIGANFLFNNNFLLGVEGDLNWANISGSASVFHGGAKLEDIFSQIQAGEVATLNLIIKADVTGSLEAVTASLKKLEAHDGGGAKQDAGSQCGPVRQAAGFGRGGGGGGGGRGGFGAPASPYSDFYGAAGGESGYMASNPNWRAGDSCFTDDGYGRMRPCSAGYKAKQAK